MAENELQHYGVLGMKWGIRKKTTGIVSTKGQERRKAWDEKPTSFKPRFKQPELTYVDNTKKAINTIKKIQKLAKSRSAKGDMVGKTSDRLKEELDRDSSFKETATKLRKKASDFENLVNKAYSIKDKQEQDKAFKEVDKAWDDYVAERNRAVDSLLGSHANTTIKATHGNATSISDAKYITTLTLDKLSDWRYQGLS